MWTALPTARLVVTACACLAVASSHLLQLAKDEVCKRDAVGDWTCKLLGDCPEIDPRKSRPDICSFEGIKPIICCPPQATPKAEKKCSDYKSKLCSAPFVKRDLTNPSVPKKPRPNEHIHLARIGYGPTGRKSWKCGGSLISERYVLSAAHCTNLKDEGPAMWARLGEFDYGTDEFADMEIVERTNHPDYRPPAVYHDIALYKLEHDMLLNAWVKPVCLHAKSGIPSSQAIATAWVGTGSPTLMEVELPLLDVANCRRLLRNASVPSLPNGVDSNGMICAGTLMGGEANCNGDSGGVLLFKDESCLKSAIGVRSFDSGCSRPNSPVVFTRISHYIRWIQTIVWPSD